MTTTVTGPIGTPITIASLISGLTARSTNDSVAAAGTNQATATALTALDNTVVSGTGGVRADSLSAGASVRVMNYSGVTINVYAKVGYLINGQASTQAFPVANGDSLLLVGMTATTARIG